MSRSSRSKYLDKSDILPSASLFSFDFGHGKKKNESKLSSAASTPDGPRSGRSKRYLDNVSENEKDDDDFVSLKKSAKTSTKDSKKRKIESPKTSGKSNLSIRNRKEGSSTKKSNNNRNRNVSSSRSRSPPSTHKKSVTKKSKTYSSSSSEDDEDNDDGRSKKSPVKRPTTSSSKQVQNKSSHSNTTTTNGKQQTKKPTKLAVQISSSEEEEEDDEEEEEIDTRSKKSVSPPKRPTTSSSKNIQNKSSKQKSPPRNNVTTGKENTKNLERTKKSNELAIQISSSSEEEDDDDDVVAIETGSQKSASPVKQVQNKKLSPRTTNGKENTKILEKTRESTEQVVKSIVNKKKSKSNIYSSNEEEDEEEEENDKEDGGSKKSYQTTDTISKNIQNLDSPRQRPTKTSTTSGKQDSSKIPKNSEEEEQEEQQKILNKDDEKRKIGNNTKRIIPSTSDKQKPNAENIQSNTEKSGTKITKNNLEREEESEVSDTGSHSQTENSNRQKPESPRRLNASINHSPLTVHNRNAIEDDEIVMPTMPNTINPEPTFVDALPDRDMVEYCSLVNAGNKIVNYVRVPVGGPSVSFALTGEHIWTEVQPGILTCTTFDGPKIKTGFMRIFGRTIKPFEKTTTGQITLAVMEGTVRIKSTTFDFDNKRQPYLVSSELSPGGHIYIPNQSMYSLENWSIDEDASLHYCIIRDTTNS